jgi:hypothetical protein
MQNNAFSKLFYRRKEYISTREEPASAGRKLEIIDQDTCKDQQYACNFIACDFFSENSPS